MQIKNQFPELESESFLDASSFKPPNNNINDADNVPDGSRSSYIFNTKHKKGWQRFPPRRTASLEIVHAAETGDTDYFENWFKNSWLISPAAIVKHWELEKKIDRDAYSACYNPSTAVGWVAKLVANYLRNQHYWKTFMSRDLMDAFGNIRLKRSHTDPISKRNKDRQYDDVRVKYENVFIPCDGDLSEPATEFGLRTSWSIMSDYLVNNLQFRDPIGAAQYKKEIQNVPPPGYNFIDIIFDDRCKMV